MCPGQQDQLLCWLRNTRTHNAQMLKSWLRLTAGCAAGSKALGGARQSSGKSPSCPHTGMNGLVAAWDRSPQDAQQENKRGLPHCGWHWPWSSHPQQTQPAPRGMCSQGLTPRPHIAWNLIMFSIKEVLEDNPPRVASATWAAAAARMGKLPFVPHK